MIDPWLDDWSDTDQSNGDQGGYSAENANAGPGYDQGPPYSDDRGVANEQPYAGASQAEPQPQASPRQSYRGTPSASAASEESLTVVFNNGRAPQQMQNYMISSSALTVLDRDHQEQIPLDQIDVAATRQMNRSRGLDFRIPEPGGD